MTTPPEIIRKVSRLDNDVAAIYEILVRVETTQRRHDSRLDEQAAKLEQLATTQGEHSAKLDEHSVKLDEHSVKLDTIIELLRQRP